MVAIQSLVLSISLLMASVAYGSPVKAQGESACNAAMTKTDDLHSKLDSLLDSFDLVRKSRAKDTSKKRQLKTKILTLLMSEYLGALTSELNSWEEVPWDIEFKKIVDQYNLKYKQAPLPHKPTPFPQTMNRYYRHEYGDYFLHVGVTNYNRPAIRKLVLLLQFIDDNVDSGELWDRVWGDYPNKKRFKKFLERDMDQFLESLREYTLKFGYLTILQAAGWLTVSSVDGISSPEELLKTVTRPSIGSETSLMVKLALGIDSNVIGPHSEWYIPKPLVSKDGEVVWSPRMQEFLVENSRRRRDKHDPKNKEITAGDLELGYGCPVARCQKGLSQSALQGFINSLMNLYEEI